MTSKLRDRWELGGQSSDLDEDSLISKSIVFRVEDLLPSSEVQLTIGDGCREGVIGEERFEVGIAVVFTGLVMSVVFSKGGEIFQPE